MNTTTRMLSIAATALLSMFACAKDVFDVTLSLNVPRVYQNEQSQGYRKIQRQTVKGEMTWEYGADGRISDVRFSGFVNRTHVMSNGRNVTYDVDIDRLVSTPRFNLIGSNKTGVFKTPSVSFFLVMEPSYNIGALDEDNALYVMLSGKGTTAVQGNVKTLTGNVAGTIGCGCTAYGHKSPTRVIGEFGATDNVDDVAAVYGTWKAVFNRKKSDPR